MTKPDFLAKLNEIFKASDDCYGETIIDVKLRVYSSDETSRHYPVDETCLWCQLDDGTTEAAINKEGEVNFALSGWNHVADEMKHWVALAKLANPAPTSILTNEDFPIPFDE